jgi:hypothetical protein
MKKITKTVLFIALIFVCSNFSYSQDMITKKTGEDITAKVLEVTTSEIKYKKFDNLDGPTFSILKSEVLIIRYKNGTKDVFNIVTPAAVNEVTVTEQKNENDMFAKGKADAKSFYRGKNSGSGWTVATTVLTSPIIGVLPAALCASSDPNDDNLMYPNPTLMKNADYNKAYIDEAHRIKNKKVWKAFGISSAAWLGLILVLSSQ